MKIYTDGSCIDTCGGWAVVINKEKVIKKYTGCEENTTNNRMELYAVCRALEEIKNIYIDDGVDTFEIFSDSAYVVNSINNGCLDKWLENGWKTTKGLSIKNKDIWLLIYIKLKWLKKNNVKVEIIKIKAHSGNTFNELADILAKDQAECAKSIKSYRESKKDGKK